jgi:hypothetical protein
LPVPPDTIDIGVMKEKGGVFSKNQKVAFSYLQFNNASACSPAGLEKKLLISPPAEMCPPICGPK